MADLQTYLYYGQTTSLCEECLCLVPAKIVFFDNDVYYLKHCKEHGDQKTLISTDRDYYLRSKTFLKTGDIPLKRQTNVAKGCPHDCGLCPDHEQHSCLAIIEVTDKCDLFCPTCYASSGGTDKSFRTLDTIEKMLDTLVESEGHADLVQISGGEPTLHPQIIDILKMARDRPIRHLMLVTNGRRIAEDQDFVKSLKQFSPGFEIYLQFDSLDNKTLKTLRGEELLEVRNRALENLESADISTTLVCTVQKGINDSEADAIIKKALTYRMVRGVTFQPVQYAGRNDQFDINANRIILSEIRTKIAQGSNAFGEEDLIPLPCHPEAISIGYALREGENITPITSIIPVEEILEGAKATISFEKNSELKERLLKTLSLSALSPATMENAGELLCCLPRVDLPKELSYENVFRIVIVSFMDRFNFCLGSVKRSCIHFVTPDKKIVPFDTYNLFHRSERNNWNSDNEEKLDLFHLPTFVGMLGVVIPLVFYGLLSMVPPISCVFFPVGSKPDLFLILGIGIPAISVGSLILYVSHRAYRSILKRNHTSKYWLFWGVIVNMTIILYLCRLLYSLIQ